MRRIFGTILTGCLLGLFWPAAVFGAAVIDLASYWEEDEPFSTTLAWRDNWRGRSSEWDWSGKVYLTDPEDAYSLVGLRFNRDGRFQDLSIDCSGQWNERYRLTGAGIKYQWQPWRGMKTVLDYETGLRMAAPDYDDRYRYHWDRQRLEVQYRFSAVTYNFQLLRYAKQYPEAEYYTSVKHHLGQELIWEPRPRFRISLSYDEYTGYYPDDESYPRDYWKESWGLRLAAGSSDRWRAALSYSRLEWVQAYDPYREDRRYELRLQAPPRWPLQIALKAGFADLAYFSDTIYEDPEEDGEAEEEDLNSRFERKLSLAISRHFKVFQWESEFFGRVVDYHSPARADLWDSGFSTTLEWKWQRYHLQLELAPWGSFSDRDANCRLKLGYRFT